MESEATLRWQNSKISEYDIYHMQLGSELGSDRKRRLKPVKDRE